MKTLKQALSLLLALCMILSGPLPVSAAEVSTPGISGGIAIDQDASKDLVIYGDASKRDDGTIELTPLDIWMSGSVWYNRQIDTNSGFTTQVDFWAGGGRDDFHGGADGIVVTFAANTGLGEQGEYLGFVPGSYGVELDSYFENPGDPWGKHIAIIHEEVSNHVTYTMDGRVDDSQWHTLKITYTPGTLAVYLDNTLVLSQDAIELPGKVYLGISAATGDGRNQHLIRDFYMEGVVSEGKFFEDFTPVGSLGYNGNYYEIYDLPMTWTQAKEYCEKLGGHLMTITSEEEQANAMSLLEYGNQHQYWLGAHRVNGDIVWITGEDFTYENWDWGEPNCHSKDGGAEEDYIQIFNKPNPATYGSERGKWNDIFEDNIFPWEEDFFSTEYIGFICEYEDDPRCDTGSTILRLSNKPFQYYTPIESKTVKYTFNYDESWFFKDSTDYNHNLARMSIRMAMAAARTSDVSIVDLFDTLDFSYVNEISGTDDNLKVKDGDTIKYPSPTKDTIGYAIGSKEITDENGETITLIAVAVRGGGYKAEWASNFTIGPSSEHAGFSQAANYVVNAVKDYISERNIKSNIKIWMTGYSRAAATTNIAAHTLTADARNGRIPGLEQTGIYAYCFECPRTVWTTHPSYKADDSNIFNIVNPVDFVPLVAPEAWKFDRYGVTYYLPSSELNYSNFNEANNRMVDYYYTILDAIGSDQDEWELSDFPKTQYTNLKKTVNALAKYFDSQSTYVVGYQSAVTKSLESFNSDTFDIGAILEVILGVLPAFLVLHPFVSSYLALNTGNISKAHYPELCLAWMDSLQGNELIKNAKTRYLTVNCPVNIYVYDSEENCVAEIVDNQVWTYSSIGAMVDENGQKILILPCDEEFTVEFEATDNGTMSWQIQEYDIDAGEATRVINYYDIEIHEDEFITGTLSEASGNAAVAFEFTDEFGEQIEADEELTGTQVVELTVDVTCEGNGTALGGGTFVCGEYVKVIAESDAEAEFLGWYKNGTLVSTEAEYRFRVEEHVSLVAKFSANEIIGDLNGDGNVNDADVAYLLWHTLFPDAYPISANGDFNGNGIVDDQDVAYLLWHTLFPDAYPL